MNQALVCLLKGGSFWPPLLKRSIGNDLVITDVQSQDVPAEEACVLHVLLLVGLLGLPEPPERLVRLV